MSAGLWWQRNLHSYSKQRGIYNVTHEGKCLLSDTHTSFLSQTYILMYVSVKTFYPCFKSASRQKWEMQCNYPSNPAWTLVRQRSRTTEGGASNPSVTSASDWVLVCALETSLFEYLFMQRCLSYVETCEVYFWSWGEVWAYNPDPGLTELVNI